MQSFYLGGNPQGGPREVSGKNILNGFTTEILSEIFDVDTETITRMKVENDERGCIIRVEHDLELLNPKREEIELRKMRKMPNGIEETFCSISFKQNIDEPSDAEIYRPFGGRINILNGVKFPLFQYLKLSAERGVLNKNVMLTPQWNTNAHTIVYITRGASRVQVARENGQLVFDGHVKEGQLLVIPQDFVFIAKAGEDGLEWVAFKTNENAVISPLAGQMSVVRGMPVPVIMSSYGLSREDAMRLKYMQGKS